jgi:transcriptional regulator with PAS, ATPase and Fis domain
MSSCSGGYLELDLANSDLTNLLASTSIPVIMVGGDLRLRRITGPAKQVLNLLPTDLGRPINDLSLSAVAPDLAEMVHEVIERVQPVEREVSDREGRWHLMRVYPYRTAEHKIDGAVIVLIDVDQIRHAKEVLQRQTEQLSQQAQLIGLSQMPSLCGTPTTRWCTGTGAPRRSTAGKRTR